MDVVHAFKFNEYYREIICKTSAIVEIMKVGILTHPQGANYGGILQCYALCSYLRKLGHEPIVIQRVANQSIFIWRWIRSLLSAIHFSRYYHPKEVDRLANIRPFILKYIPRTEPFDSYSKMNKISSVYALDAVIVGSDQVWRHDYAMQFGYNYFLDFVPDNVIKLSYAASFGLSEWQYSSQETKIIRNLLSRFSAISVREEEAISLLENNVGCNAIQLIDPTMLLTADDYNQIASNRLEADNYIFVYWLGDKQLIQDEISAYKNHGYKVVDINLKDNQEQISVEDWISYIKYADYVITDSFHGCVFSLIFNRPFKVEKNDSGGYGRIVSLCKLLDISFEDMIDFKSVNSRISDLRGIAHEYLTSILK